MEGLIYSGAFEKIYKKNPEVTGPKFCWTFIEYLTQKKIGWKGWENELFDLWKLKSI